MDSRVAYTDEIDDLNEAVQEIYSQLADFELKTNSLAIVFAEEDTDYPEFYKLLSQKWKFPIIGCTALSMITGGLGYCGTGISVMVLTADDCKFEAGITDPLATENYEGAIRNVYEKTANRLGDEVKLIISFGMLVTSVDNVPGDEMLRTLDVASGHKPIFGGLASDGFTYTGTRVFFNDRAVENGLTMALVSGNIKPVWVCRNSIENKANFSYQITKSDKNRVYKLGNGSFIETMRRAQFQVDKTDVMGDYLLSPFVVTITQPDGESVEVARNLSILDHSDESGIFLGGMPEGSYLGIGYISRDDVQKSILTAINSLSDSIKNEPKYEYKTILCMTCAARFLALASNLKAEGDMCKEHLPAGFSLMGMYAYGEFCTLKGSKTEADYNTFHNFTFAALAF